MVVQCSTPCSSVAYWDTSTARFADSTAFSPFPAMLSRMLVSFCQKASYQIRQAILRRWASFAEMGSPVSIILVATLVPVILGKSWVPPIPGIKPRLISGKANAAFLLAIMMLVRRASSNPPPKALPSTTEMMGFLILRKTLTTEMKCKVWGYLAQSLSFMCLMSAPAQNTFGCLLRMTMVLTSLSWSRPSMAYLIQWVI